jgi:hypothetical protein
MKVQVQPTYVFIIQATTLSTTETELCCFGTSTSSSESLRLYRMMIELERKSQLQSCGSI